MARLKQNMVQTCVQFCIDAERKGIKLNPEKLAICQTEVDYFSHIISGQCLQRDAVPKNGSELETVVGMITYLAFAPSLSEVTAPMRMLLSSRSEFVSDAAQDETFNKTKSILTSKLCSDRERDECYLGVVIFTSVFMVEMR